jgi:hypothetical protein
MPTRISAENFDPEVKSALRDMLLDIEAGRVGGQAAVRADLAALRAAIVAITAKLDADAGVTDTNYAATTNPAAITSVAIAAINTTA